MEATGPSSAPGRSSVARVLGVDSRSLALVRVALAAVVLIDLALRARFLVPFHTDDGVFPRAVLRPPPQFSLYFLGDGSAALPAGLFVATAVSALLLLVGWHTRVVTALTWWLVVCLQVRNPLMTNNGDVLLRALLLWGIFLPLGRSASLDARRRGSPGPARVVSIGSAALVGQLVLLYLAAGVVKLTPAWTSGDAVQLVLGQEQFGRPLGLWLRGHPALTTAMTHATLAFEIAGPLLLLSPWRPALVRGLVVPGLWLLQLGLGTSIELGLFPWTSTIASFAVLGPRFWSAVGRPFGRGGVRELPLEGPRGAPERALQGVALALFLWVLALNAPILVHRPKWRALETAWPSRALGLIQDWRLYAVPPDEDQSFEILGVREDGRALDLLARGEGERWDRVRALYAAYRTRYMLWRIGLARKPEETRALLSAHLAWLCREWNASQAPRRALARTSWVRVARAIRLDGHGPETRSVLAEFACQPADAGAR